MMFAVRDPATAAGLMRSQVSYDSNDNTMSAPSQHDTGILCLQFCIKC